MMDNETVVESVDFRLNEIGNFWTWSYNSREVTSDWAGKGCLHVIFKGSTFACDFKVKQMSMGMGN